MPASHRPIRDVAAIALPGVNPFELGVACEGFGIDRSDDGAPNFDFALCSLDAAPVPTSAGWSILAEHRLDRAESADLVVLPAAGTATEWPGEVLRTVRETLARGAEVMSICSGAFVLGAAGVLDGRRCTVHWKHATALAHAFPAAQVDPDVLYVSDGPVHTSAGTAAGLDLCLHLIRRDFGAEIANICARRMVMPAHRDGGQAQFVDVPVRCRPAESLEPLLETIRGELADEHTVTSMASRAAMSPRTFARRFRDETGTTPHSWLTHQRVLLARRMLENSDVPVETVARDSGFGDAATLRHHFQRIVRVSPAAYRRTFRAAS